MYRVTVARGEPADSLTLSAPPRKQVRDSTSLAVEQPLPLSTIIYQRTTPWRECDPRRRTFDRPPSKPNAVLPESKKENLTPIRLIPPAVQKSFQVRCSALLRTSHLRCSSSSLLQSLPPANPRTFNLLHSNGPPSNLHLHALSTRTHAHDSNLITSFPL